MKVGKKDEEKERFYNDGCGCGAVFGGMRRGRVDR